MTMKELRAENDIKRELLTEQNEAYYSKLLVYVRLQFFFGEHRAEEVLIEMLDHLLEGQEEGKTAAEIFGDNPKGYADELIGQLPKDGKRSLFSFCTYFLIYPFAGLLMIRGIMLLIFLQFKAIDQHIYLYSGIAFSVAVIIVYNVAGWLSSRGTRRSIFGEEESIRKSTVRGGLRGGLLIGFVVAVMQFYKEQGPAILIPWYGSLAVGFVLWLVSRVIKYKAVPK